MLPLLFFLLPDCPLLLLGFLLLVLPVQSAQLLFYLLLVLPLALLLFLLQSLYDLLVLVNQLFFNAGQIYWRLTPVGAWLYLVRLLHSLALTLRLVHALAKRFSAAAFAIYRPKRVLLVNRRVQRDAQLVQQGFCCCSLPRFLQLLAPSVEQFHLRLKLLLCKEVNQSQMLKLRHNAGPRFFENRHVDAVRRILLALELNRLP